MGIIPEKIKSVDNCKNFLLIHLFKNKNQLAFILFLFIFPFKLASQTDSFNKFSIGLTGGTTGFGGEVATNISKKVNLRFSITGFSYSEKGEEADENITFGYEAKGSIGALALLLDYHPFNSSFKLIAGVVKNNFEINGFSTALTPYEFNSDRTFSPERVGSISALLTYPNTYMPYLGFGFGNSLSKGSAIKLNLSLGVLYSESPKLEMEGTGLISPTINQIKNLQEGLNEFGWYPMLNLGVSLQLFKKNKEKQ